MREHALPQDVTGYKFHIIGNMTLKQFAEVAAGCVVGFILYNTNLPYLIKWPLIFFSGGFGAMLAFVPFEERPLDQWFVALIMALYRPTQFFWKRSTKIPEPFLYQPHQINTSVLAQVDLSPARRQRVKEYLHSIHSEEAQEIDPDTQIESQVLSLFDTQQAVGTNVTARFGSSPARSSASTHERIKPAVTSQPQLDPAVLQPTAEIQFQQRTLPTDTVSTHLTASVLRDTPNPMKAEPKSSNLPSEPTVATSVSVPELQNISVTPTYQNGHSLDSAPVPDTVPLTDSYVDPSIQAPTETPYATQAVVENVNLPFPDPPTEPNKIVGMAIDQNNTPLQNVIIEIVTENNMPARAVKTNLLGQFFITTPLANGSYILQAEKEGYQFPPQQLVLNGQIVNPIEVRST